MEANRLRGNMKKESVMLDFAGNEIDPRTKQIIKPAIDPNEYKPTAEDIARLVNLPKDPVPIPKEIKSEAVVVKKIPLQEQIVAAEKMLAELRLQKAGEIERIKKELEELEKA